MRPGHRQRAFVRSCITYIVACFVQLCALESAAGTLRKGPYFTHVGAHELEARLEFSTDGDVPVVGVLLLGGQAAGTISSASRDLHVLSFSRLNAATTYEFIAKQGGVEIARGHVTTAPVERVPFRFMAYGDARSQPAAHEAVVRAMLAVPADFLVHTGDMVETGDSARDWESFFQVETPLLRERAIFACVGNHELHLASQGEVPFLRYFGTAPTSTAKLYETFRWSTTRFFLLNAMDEWTGEERDWLANALEAARSETDLDLRIAVLHHGPFSSGPHGPNKRLLAGGVLQLLERGGVDLVLSGHDHTYERGRRGSLKYLVTGGAGAPLYPEEKRIPETEKFEASYHFVEMAVTGTRVQMAAHRVSGSLIENCSFEGKGAWQCVPTGATRVEAPPIPEQTAPAAGPAPVRAPRCACRVPGEGPESGGGALCVLAMTVLFGLRRTRT